MDEQTNDVCRYCREPIQAYAKKCPHCHEWLTWWSTKNPFLGVVFSVLAIGFLCLLLWKFLSDVNPKEKFPGHKQELEVKSSSMAYDDSGSDRKIAVVGTISNTGDLTWNDITLEAQFYDSSGQLVDTISDSKFSLVVGSHGEASFRIGGLAMLPREKYASHKISITWARRKGIL